MNPSYIANNQEELFDKASPEIQQLILGEEINKVTTTLGQAYKLHLSLYVDLSNIISFILIGAIKPKDVLRALEEALKLSPEEAYKMAQDLDKSILEKARIRPTSKSSSEMVTLTFTDNNSSDELRKEILDTTKRESGFDKDQSTPNPKVLPSRGSTLLTPGSRSQLLEQFQVLDSIPNDEEVGNRLDQIKEQLASLDNQRENGLDSNIALQEFMFGEKGSNPVEAKAGPATYSKAPTKYNIDPYRETSEE